MEQQTRLKAVIAIVNNKGGVGKTTTVQNVAAGLIRRNPKLRVGCIDLDPQGNLSTLLGWHEMRKRIPNALTVADALQDGDSNHLPFYPANSPGIWYCPASQALADIEPALHAQMSSKQVLTALFGNEVFDMNALYLKETTKYAPIGYIEDFFDYILIDCAPALSELTYNALAAASWVIIPVQLGSLSIDGIARMIEAYRKVRQKLNPDLELRGLLIVMADERTNLARETIDYLRDTYGEVMFKSRIRQCIKVGESQYKHVSIFDWASDCTAAHDYEDFIKELLTSKK